VLPPGGRLLLSPAAAAEVRVLDESERPLPQGVVIASASGEAQDDPVRAAPSLYWLLTWLLTQLLVVALPEEMFFRGYVLGRLRGILPARRTILGVPFGWAHVVSAALFAVIHLVLVPAPQRLLVFFPGLLFAWLAERSRGVFASAGHHALANVCQSALLLLYAPR
jgi:membrane protease YdiL (CAAX protease family)